MLTLGTLLRASNQNILHKRGKYQLNAFSTKSGEDDFGEYVRFLAQVIGGSKPRKSTISAYDSQISIASPVIVYCSCDYFKYNLEIALAARGSALQLHAEGVLPQIRNKEFKPGLCVHLALLAEIALSADTTKQAIKKAVPRISKKLK